MLKNYKLKNHVTPRPLLADAYTAGSDRFQSAKAKQKSNYYITFRRPLIKINPTLYKAGDDRILLFNLQRIIERILYTPVTHFEVDEARDFLASAKITAKGIKEYYFPEHLWRRIVDEFGGRIPIRITAFPEGSVVYPNEPVMQIESLVDGFGELAAWFEAVLLHIWNATELGTQDRHWFSRLCDMVRMVNPDASGEQLMLDASSMLTDFGARAATSIMEMEDLGMTGLYTFPGSDTLAGGYQAWKNSNHTPGVLISVNALAHRNVQAWDEEGDAYNSIYENSGDNEFISMVQDCYDSKRAVVKYHIPLAIRASQDGSGKVIVGRPDSNDPKDEVLFMCREAVKAGLYTTKIIGGKEWKFATHYRFIQGDGMTFEVMWDIMMALIEEGFAPYGWGLFGQGGGRRNFLKRDNLSAKYALCSMGDDYQSVVKFSDTYGKTTLPGPFKVLRSQDALNSKQTVVFTNEPGTDAMVMYYDGLEEQYFGPGMYDDFNQIKTRSHEQFDTYPKTLWTEDNHGYPASLAVIERRRELLEKFAPNKEATDY